MTDSKATFEITGRGKINHGSKPRKTEKSVTFRQSGLLLLGSNSPFSLSRWRRQGIHGIMMDQECNSCMRLDVRAQSMSDDHKLTVLPAEHLHQFQILRVTSIYSSQHYQRTAIGIYPPNVFTQPN
jgi:hypothetical protein